MALDEPIALTRPRSHGQIGFARHEQRILDRVLRQPDAAAAHETDVANNVLTAPAPALRRAI